MIMVQQMVQHHQITIQKKASKSATNVTLHVRPKSLGLLGFSVAS
jgi:hypothetical protein